MFKSCVHLIKHVGLLGSLAVFLTASFLAAPGNAQGACFFLTQSLVPRSLDATTQGQVTLLQQFLAQDPTLYPEGLVTGFFGPATLRAVQRFQVQNGIVNAGTPITTGFGAVGRRTRALINTKICDKGTTIVTSLPPATPPSNSAPVVAPTPVAPIQTLSVVPAPIQRHPTPIVLPAPIVVPAPVVTPVVQVPALPPISVPAPLPVVLPQTPSFASATVTSAHRFQQGVAYGGWGPHLGKLLRSTTNELYLADDTGNDVTRNAGLAYYKQVNGQWVQIGSNAFLGTVQQNTGSVMKGTVIFTYGIDTENHRVEECYFDTVQNTKGCKHLPFVLPANSNYIGAALTPSGHRVVWWTNGGNGAPGTFEYIYNFGNGWNGVVSSNIAGFSAVGYINIAFYDDSRFVLHAKLMAGVGPQWTFIASYADGSLGSQITTWGNLASVGASDLISATNDVWIDPQGGTHILGQSVAGTTSYHYRSPGSNGAFSKVLASFPGVYRARFIKSTDGNLYVAYGKQGDGLRVITIPLSSINGALSLQESASQKIATSAGYEFIDAIYSESSIYQTQPVSGFNVAINGSTRQGEIVHIQLR